MMMMMISMGCISMAAITSGDRGWGPDPAGCGGGGG
jgi:hypothetical protein